MKTKTAPLSREPALFSSPVENDPIAPKAPTYSARGNGVTRAKVYWKEQL